MKSHFPTPKTRKMEPVSPRLLPQVLGTQPSAGSVIQILPADLSKVPKQTNPCFFKSFLQFFPKLFLFCQRASWFFLKKTLIKRCGTCMYLQRICLHHSSRGGCLLSCLPIRPCHWGVSLGLDSCALDSRRRRLRRLHLLQRQRHQHQQHQRSQLLLKKMTTFKAAAAAAASIRT